jgi:four helix bundle suffix protein
MSKGFIPPHGGYRNLLSYQKAEIVYDATVYFCGACQLGRAARRLSRFLADPGRVTTYLLDRQLRSLEIAFVEEGGMRERMTRARLQERKKNAW